MVAWPVNWNVVRHDLVVGSGPLALSDLDAIRGATRASALLSVQHDECLEKLGIDYAAHVRHGRRLGLTMERRPLRDFDPADQRRGLPAAVRGLHGLLRQGHRVYVHCTAGLNRSPLVVLAYLTLVEGIGLEEAMTLLVLALAGVHPAPADLSRTQLRRALKVYTRAPAYRKALARGGPRYDLAGQPAGAVTPEQQALARMPRPKPAAAAETADPPARAAAPPLTGGYFKMTLKRRVLPDAGG